MRSLRPRADERALTWLVTGPIGHLAAGLIDLVGLLIRLSWDRLGRRFASARLRAWR